MEINPEKLGLKISNEQLNEFTKATNELHKNLSANTLKIEIYNLINVSTYNFYYIKSKKFEPTSRVFMFLFNYSVYYTIRENFYNYKNPDEYPFENSVFLWKRDLKETKKQIKIVSDGFLERYISNNDLTNSDTLNCIKKISDYLKKVELLLFEDK